MKGCKKIKGNISHGQIVTKKEHHVLLYFVIMFKQQMLQEMFSSGRWMMFRTKLCGYEVSQPTQLSMFGTSLSNHLFLESFVSLLVCVLFAWTVYQDDI